MEGSGHLIFTGKLEARMKVGEGLQKSYEVAGQIKFRLSKHSFLLLLPSSSDAVRESRRKRLHVSREIEGRGLRERKTITKLRTGELNGDRFSDRENLRIPDSN